MKYLDLLREKPIIHVILRAALKVVYVFRVKILLPIQEKTHSAALNTKLIILKCIIMKKTSACQGDSLLNLIQMYLFLKDQSKIRFCVLHQ